MDLINIPYLRHTNGSKQLIVDGKPYLILGAELQNSSFSSAIHMTPIWSKMVEMNVNTVLGSVSWEMIEPNEGQFDFAEMDRIIEGARAHNLKLILLWFGTWKNGISTYVPTWVKTNPKRFPRVEIRAHDGAKRVTEIMSPVHGATLEADIAAFKAFISHLKDVDASHSTVILVQVENEVGTLGDSRDYSDEASRIFNKPVPTAFTDFLHDDWNVLHPDFKANLSGIKTLPTIPYKETVSWPGLFGEGTCTDEMFMAYHYANYLENVAAAGKAIYPIPMFANFWLNYHEDDQAQQYPVLAGGGNSPGDYPSGGAVSTVLDIWMRFAPSLDFLSPDTYLNDYHRICTTYRHRSQPLFIPEQRRDEHGARRTWAAIGSYQALGACPFALDTLDVNSCAYTRHYGLMKQVSAEILNAQKNPESIMGFFFDEPAASPRREHLYVRNMGGYELQVQRAFTTGPQDSGYGVVIHVEGSATDKVPAKFLLVGAGFQVKFKALDPQACFTGILDFKEKARDVEGNKFVTLRQLNGDETRSGQQVIMPNEKPDDGGFPINITIPAVTRIAECTVYHLKG